MFFRYTAGVVGGLSTIAVCAPSEKFLNMGGPLAIGFGVVLASSLGILIIKHCLVVWVQIDATFMVSSVIAILFV